MRWLLVLGLTGLALPSLRAQELGPVYRDEARGFSLRPPAKWTGIPVSPAEHVAVAQWRGKSPDNSKTGKGFMPELCVLAFPNSDAARTAAGSASDRPADYESYLRKVYGSGAKVLKQEESTIGGLKVRVFQVSVPVTGGDQARLHTTLYTIADQDIAVEFTCLEDKYDSHRAEFIATARSFQPVEPKRTVATESPTPDKPADANAEREKFLDEQKARAKAAGWSWMDSPSRRYLFIYNAEKPFVMELAWRLEAIRDHYERLYPPSRPIDAVSIVRVCKNEVDYHAYGGPPGTGGYWLAAARELVFFDNKDRDRDTGYAVLMHEGFHQYIYYFYGELAPHSWYNEGHGDYFAGAELLRKGNTGRVLKVKPLTAQGVNRLTTIKTALQQGSTIPLRQFFQYTQAEYYARDKVHLCYAEGWSIVYFLREGTKDPKWTAILPSYLDNLLGAFQEAKVAAAAPGEIDQEEVHRKAFDRTFGSFTEDDWERLEKAWKAFQP